MSEAPVLSVRGLCTEVRGRQGRRLVVENLDLDLRPGETVCIAGESGSGKSMTAMSVMRLLPEPAALIAGGSVLLGGRDLVRLPESEMRRIRGGEIAMIFQEPMTSLNPIMTIGRQLGEAVLAHRDLAGGPARDEVLRALRAVRLSDPERRLRQYPHELSGGMRQRVMIAMALACRPRVLIADEPTTALDVTVQAQILDLMRELQQGTGMALVLITHDMGVVAEMADRVLVMHRGRIVEGGPVERIFGAPEQDYTRALLAAVPRLGAMAGTDAPRRAGGPAARGRASPLRASPPLQGEGMGEGSPPGAPVLSVRELTVRFDLRSGILQRVWGRVHAAEGVSFDLRAGETLALVGESGCGKSTTGKAIMGLVPRTGSIRVGGRETVGLDARGMKAVRRDVQMIFQDPLAALDPRMTVGELVGEPLEIHRLASGSELNDRVAWLFRRVGLSPDDMRRYPHAFSGGQRQRICIARALSLSPKVIIADESVSALDVSVQARVLDLLAELQAEMGLSYLFISHDMAVVEQISHRVAVMYLGQIVEAGSRRQVFETPLHPYTQRLLAAVPVPDPARRRARGLAPEGEVPSPVRLAGDEPARITLCEADPGHFVEQTASA